MYRDSKERYKPIVWLALTVTITGNSSAIPIWGRYKIRSGKQRNEILQRCPGSQSTNTTLLKVSVALCSRIAGAVAQNYLENSLTMKICHQVQISVVAECDDALCVFHRD